MIRMAKKAFQRFHDDTRAGTTMLALVLATTSLVIGGYGLDVSNVMMARTKLQISADATAHSALVARELNAENLAKATALNVATKNMPSAVYGNVIKDTDIVFGTWDSAHRSFTALAGSESAVKVEMRRSESNHNPVATYLFKMVGLEDWNLVSTAVFVTYQPTCLREGFVADGVVDLQSNNNFTNGFCIHSNTHVELNQNNYFEPGTVVSMPNTADIQLPASGFVKNVGLQDALRAGRWNIRIVNRIDGIISGLRNMESKYVPKYITSGFIKALPTNKVSQSDLVAGKIYTYTCTGNSSLTIQHDVQVSQVAIVTNCDVVLSSGVALEDAVIATSSTSANSIKGTSGVRVGRNDNCAPGGGAQLVTAGGISIPAKLEMYGGQLLAKKDVDFAANANGIQGASVVAGGVVSGTSNMDMAFCGKGMEDNFYASYFRLVE